MRKKIIINERQLSRVLQVKENFTGYLDTTSGNNPMPDSVKTHVDGYMSDGDISDSNPEVSDFVTPKMARKIPAAFAGRHGTAYGNGHIGAIAEDNQTLVGQQINVINQETGAIDYSATEHELANRALRLKQKKGQGKSTPGDDKEALEIDLALNTARQQVSNDKKARMNRGEENVYQKEGGKKNAGNGKAHSDKKITYFA